MYTFYMIKPLFDVIVWCHLRVSAGNMWWMEGIYWCFHTVLTGALFLTV